MQEKLIDRQAYENHRATEIKVKIKQELHMKNMYDLRKSNIDLQILEKDKIKQNRINELIEGKIIVHRDLDNAQKYDEHRKNYKKMTQE